MTERPAAAGGLPGLRNARSRFVSHHEYLTALFGYALVLLIFLAPFFFQGKVFAAADFHMIFSPWYHHLPKGSAPANLIRSDDGLLEYPRKLKFHEAAQDGYIPFWDAYKLGGYPFYDGLSQTMSFTPLYMWLTLIPPEVFTGLYAFARLLLAGMATYVFARTLKVSRGGAFLAGLAFMSSGPLAVWLTSVLVDLAFAFPALLACVEGFLTDGRKRWLIAAPPIIAWAVMLGHPPGIVHLALVVGAYAAVRLWQTRRLSPRVPVVNAGFLSVAALLGAGIGSVGLHTMLVFTRMSEQAVRDSASIRLPLESILMFVYPNMYGVYGSHPAWLRMPVVTAWGGPLNYCELMPYVGLLPLVLAFVAAWRRRRVREAAILTWMAGVFVLLVYRTPLPVSLFSSIPVLQAVQNTRLLVPLAMVVSVLAGMGLDEIASDSRPRVSGKSLSLTFGAGAAVFVAVSAAAARVTASVTPTRWDANVAQSVYQAAFDALQAREHILVPTLAIAAAALLWLVVRRRISSSTAVAAMIVFVAVDGLLLGAGFNPQLDRQRILPETRSIRELRAMAKGWRVAPVGDQWVLGGGDLASAYGLESLGGYDMLGISPLTPMLRGVDPRSNPGTSSIGNTLHSDSRLPSPVLDALSVRYLVADSEETTTRVRLVRAGYREVMVDDIAVYENERVLPRAWSVRSVAGFPLRREQLSVVQDRDWDPRTTASSEDRYSGTYSPAMVRVASWKPGDVTLAVESTGTAFVVLSEMWIQRWSVRVDGGPASTAAITDYGLLGARVPPGKHTLRFRYESPGFARWAAISLLFAVVWLVASAAWVLSGRRASEKPGSAA